MTTDPVNHHAGHPGFAGVTGLLAGLAMIVAGSAVAQLIADLAAVSDADDVVDVGCGPGSAVREAARRRARVTGVDPAPVMLRVARALTWDRPGIRWVEGTAEDLGLRDGSATVVWSLATIHHWLDVTAGLAEVKRVLVPAGGSWRSNARCVPAPPGSPATGGQISRPRHSRLSAGQPASTTWGSSATHPAAELS